MRCRPITPTCLPFHRPRIHHQTIPTPPPRSGSVQPVTAANAAERIWFCASITRFFTSTQRVAEFWSLGGVYHETIRHHRFDRNDTACHCLHTRAAVRIWPQPSRVFLFCLRFRSHGFPILFAVLLLPLRAGLRRLMPASTPHTRAIAAFIVLLAVHASFTLPRQLSGVPAPLYMHGYLANWIFWSVFIAVITLAFFWPFRAQT